MIFVHGFVETKSQLLQIVLLLFFLYTWFHCFQIWWKCPCTVKPGSGHIITTPTTTTNNNNNHNHHGMDTKEGEEEHDDGGDGNYYFQAPFCPWLPCLGTFVNWYLISQLEMTGILLLLVYLGLAMIFYFTYGAKHSLANNGGWGIINPNHHTTTHES